MIETSLTEIFSGDVPRIDNMVIIPNSAPKLRTTSSWIGWSKQVLGKCAIGFNIQAYTLKKMTEAFPVANIVLLVRTDDGFKVESGDLPESFRGTFVLEYRVSFKRKDLPNADDRRDISRLVGGIKSVQADIDRGVVGSTYYGMSGQLWAGVKALHDEVESLE